MGQPLGRDSRGRAGDVLGAAPAFSASVTGRRLCCWWVVHPLELVGGQPVASRECLREVEGVLRALNLARRDLIEDRYVGQVQFPVLRHLVLDCLESL